MPFASTPIPALHSPRFGSGRARFRRGNVAIFTAFSLTGALAFAALAVDLGYRHVVEQQLQNAADAAALAGASVLASGGPDGARRVAQEVAAANVAGGQPVVLDDADVEIGNWNAITSSWVPNEDEGTMVRVVSRREDLPEFFAAAASWSIPRASASSIAGSSGGDCGFFAYQEVTISGNPVLNGGACSNADVTVSGNVTVNGDVLSGPGDSVDVSGSNTINGRIGQLAEELDFDFPSTGGPWNNATLSCPSGSSSCNTAGTDLSLSGQKTLSLSAGSYHWKNISLSGQAKIRITSGPVYIYASESCSMSGQGVLNTTADAEKLEMYCRGDTSLSGNAGWYGTLYSSGALKISGGGSAWAFHGMTLTDDKLTISGNVEMSATGSVNGDGESSGPRLVR